MNNAFYYAKIVLPRNANFVFYININRYFWTFCWVPFCDQSTLTTQDLKTTQKYMNENFMQSDQTHKIVILKNHINDWSKRPDTQTQNCVQWKSTITAYNVTKMATLQTSEISKIGTVKIRVLFSGFCFFFFFKKKALTGNWKEKSKCARLMIQSFVLFC